MDTEAAGMRPRPGALGPAVGRAGRTLPWPCGESGPHRGGFRPPSRDSPPLVLHPLWDLGTARALPEPGCCPPHPGPIPTHSLQDGRSLITGLERPYSNSPLPSSGRGWGRICIHAPPPHLPSPPRWAPAAGTHAESGGPARDCRAGVGARGARPGLGSGTSLALLPLGL